MFIGPCIILIVEYRETNLMSLAFLFHYLMLNMFRMLSECFLTKFFYREGLLAPRPIPKLEDHPSSAFRGCLFSIFAATLLIGGRSSIRSLRTRHAVVTGTHYMDVKLFSTLKVHCYLMTVIHRYLCVFRETN